MQWARQVLSQGAIRMKRIPRHRHTCLLSKQATPVARVAPGESVVFETWDALGGRVRSHKDALELSLPREMGNPATGPVYVEGARTGDTLGVEIMDIRLGDLGYGRVKSGGVIIDELKPPAANLTPIRNGMVRFNETLSLVTWMSMPPSPDRRFFFPSRRREACWRLAMCTLEWEMGSSMVADSTSLPM